ncbi:MAG: TDT family transporter [Methanosphaera sp.]|nr:TDT family transporter [Methanosphaera sp.]
MSNIFKRMPLGISGLLLAILSLGNILYDYHRDVKILTCLLGILIIFILLVKIIFYRNDVVNDLRNPVIASTSGTFSMALILLSTYIYPINQSIALFVWILGVLLHILLICYFTMMFVLSNFDIDNVYGSYWVVYVGITMAAITGGIIKLGSISWIFFVFGFCMMIPTFILITYRYFKYPVKNEANKPLICIYTALFSILITGYLHSFNDINMEFLMILYVIACICYVFSTYKLVSYIRMPFYPTFSAFTFPFVISVIASNEVLKTTGENIFLQIFIYYQLLVAVIIVIYVLFKYIEKYLISR